MEKINLLISVNKKFLEYTEDMLFSVLYYSSRKIDIYLMYQEEELNEKDLFEIGKFVENTNKGKVIPIKFDTKHLEGMPVSDGLGDYFGMEAYSRLFCAFKLPKEIEKILYLDADMICTGDIAELYDISFDNKTWVACQDTGIEAKDLERLELPNDTKYINSGMLLINLKKLRKNYEEKDITNLIIQNQKILIYPDQDFINKIFYGDIKIVNQKYNLLAKLVKYEDLKEKPLIIHYAGSVKPWNDDVSRFDIEFLMPYYEAIRLQGNSKKEKLEKLLEKHKKYGYAK